MRFFRRNMLLAVLLLLFCCTASPAFSATNSLSVQVDGKAVQFQALSTNNLIFVPARDVVNLFGSELSYDAKAKELTIKSTKTKAVLTIGSSSIVVNNKKVQLDASPMIVEDTTYVPVKAVSAIWGASYGANEQTLYMRTDGSPIQVPAVEKVFTKKATVSIGDKNTMVSYILVPKSSDLKADVALAQNTIGQTESLASLAKRSSAKAAINGSYFQSYDSSQSQDPFGLLIKSGKLVHAEGTGSAIGFTSSGDIKMDIVRSAITATVGGSSYTVSLVNHTPAVDSSTVVLFTSARGRSTNCAFGTSLVVQNGEVVSVSSKTAVSIPNNGYVLFFTGDKASAVQNIQKGTKVSYTISYVNQNGSKVDWSNIQTAVGAGPLLLKDGANVVNPEKEGFSDSAGFSLAVARSAVGVTSSGDILLVGGVKCTLNQLASVMSQLGATQAICMDSGSSSGLYSSGSTSLPTSSKDISNALIFK